MKNPFEFLKDITRLKQEVYEEGEYTPMWMRDTVYERLENIEDTMEAILDKLGVSIRYIPGEDFDDWKAVCVDNDKPKKTSSAKTKSK